MNEEQLREDDHPRADLAVGAIVWGMFLAFSAIRAPVPAVNEPHYLAKAKHYWDPAWCPGDIFLDSGNAHLVFFQLIGIVAQAMPLEATAWLGRIAGLGLLAGGWIALVRRIVPGRWAPVLTAAVFLFFAALGNLSGEWLVGGIEAKVFGYACVFLALAALIDRRWIATGAWSGAAISLHPVVGVWSALAAACALAVCCGAEPLLNRLSRSRSAGNPLEDRPRPRNGWRAAIGVALALLLALPGLWPAFELIGEGDDTIRRQAGYIQVGYRLAHHLDPLDFPLWSWAGYAALSAVWIAGWAQETFRGERRLFAWFVFAALLFALAGLAIGLRSEPISKTPYSQLSSLDFLRIRLLRFYPFRLYDLFAPLAAAAMLTALGQSAALRILPRSRRGSIAGATACAVLFAAALALSAVDRNPSCFTTAQMADWRDMCRWIEAHTPRDAQFVTPGTSWAFHWYAQRPEYVAWKNCPQDAPGIVEWNRRLRVVYRWATSHYTDQRYDADDLRALREATGADYLLTGRHGPMTIEPEHANATYRLYRLDGALASDRPH